MSQHKLRILSGDDVRRALPMGEAVAAMKGAFGELSRGDAVVPPRAHIEVADPRGDALFMPSYSPATKQLGVKVVTLFPGNPAAGLPFIQAVVVVLDATNGSPLAVLDGTTLTAIRTGAASGAATDLLARQDAAVAAIFGAGVQARTQLEAVCAVRDIREARVVDVVPGAAAAMAGAVGDRLGITARACATAAEALEGADIVCTATTSEVPVFADSELSPGTHINAVGSYKPHVREIPPETVCRARVVVDQVAMAWEEAGDLILPLREGVISEDHIRAEVGQIVLGTKPGREDAGEITFFKSVGVAIQDLAAAGRALANALEQGLGTDVDF